MSLVPSLLFLLAADAEFEKARADLKRSVAESDPTAVFDAAERIARADGKASVDALLDGYGALATQIKGLWGEKLKALQERDAHGDFRIDTKTNPPTIPAGDVNKYQKYMEALKQSQEVERRIMRLEACKRAVVQGLGKFKGEASVKELLRELAGNSSWQKRAGVAEALGQTGHSDAPAALLAQLRKDSEPQVRIAILEALAQLKVKTPEVAAAVIEQLKHETWQVRSVAAAVTTTLGLREAVEALVEALQKAEGRLKHEFDEALKALTGEDKHADYAAWKAWLDGAREALKKGALAPRPGDAAGDAPRAQTTTFYNIPVTSKNVVFILDRSGSMLEPSEWEIPADVASGAAGPGAEIRKQGDRKIDIARWQLKRALAAMPDGIEFNVIFFSHEFTPLSEKLLKLSAATRKTAFEFIDRTPAIGPTNIYDPLERGLSYAAGGAMGEKLAKSGVDTIYFLTDGMPNVGQVPEAADILIKIRELNRTRKVKIHTIGVFTAPKGPAAAAGKSEAEEGAKFLKQLAEDSGGVYTGSGAGQRKK